MKYIFIFLCSFQVHASDLILSVGEQLRLPARPQASVKVSSKSVIRVLDGLKHIDIVGLRAGITHLIIGGKNLRIRVTQENQKEFLTQLQMAVSQMRGLQLNWNEEPVRIQGRLLRFDDWLQIADLARRLRGDYIFDAQALPDVTHEAIAHLQSFTASSGYSNVRFQIRPNFIAEIPGHPNLSKAKLQRLLRPYGIPLESDDSALSIQPLIRTRLIVAEVSKSFARELGLLWPTEYQASVLPHLDATQNLLTRLRAYEQNGEAQILASPNLLCRSGGEARFHAGGEFPIRMRGRKSQGVSWKQHGVILKVRPKADDQGHLSIELETEVSLLDPSQMVDGIPALKTNSVSSHFDLTSSNTVALSGLLRRELGESHEGLPWLSEIPILGQVFSSRSFRNNQSELVIFVTPEIQDQNAKQKPEMPKGWIREDHES